MLVIVIGLVIVSLHSILEGRDEKDHKRRREKKADAAIGITFMVIAQLILSCLGVSEEFLLRNPRGGNPLAMMGWQGLWGVIMASLILIPL
jgi:hypothetical protein